MSQLTVREKDHWRERITRKIDHAIEELYAKDKPRFLEEVRRKARERAIASLGLAELKAAVEQIEQQKSELETKRHQAYREMLAILEGKPVEDIQHMKHYGEPYEVGQAITRRAKVHEEEILAETDLGRKVLQLGREKEELLDTVWLATSGKQIKQLWQKVAEILDQEPTPFQRQALEIEPIESE